MKKYLTVLLLTWSGVIWAQSGEVWLTGGVSAFANTSIGSTSPDGNPGDLSLDHAGYRIGLRFTYNSAGRLGHEVQYSYNHTGFNDPRGLLLTHGTSAEMGFNQFGYNLLYYFNSTSAEAKVRPFVTAGFQVDDFVMPYDVVNRNNADSWRPGFNYGAGMKFKLSPMFAWRFDVRGYDTGKPNWSGLLYKQGALLQQFEASVGLGFYF